MPQGSVFAGDGDRKLDRLRRDSRGRTQVESLESRMLLSTSWFVSTNGSDTNPGTLAAPFRTIQHAATLTQPGDTVLIRGGIYHETVHPAHSGTTSAPITFEAYNNESVTIDGADPITGWSSGPAYHAMQSWDLGEGNNQVFVDGQMMVEARWPNTSLDPSHPNLAHARSAAASGATTTIYDPALTQANGYWNGALIHFTPGEGWVAYTATVIASGPGYVTFGYQPSSQYEAVAGGTAYYLLGKFQALDAAGEWYRDPTTGQLYLWPTSGDGPANHLVEAKHRLYAFDLSGVSNITVRGMNIFAATINTNQNSTNIVLDHISAQYISQFVSEPSGWNQPSNTGIVLDGTGDVLQNSQIGFSAGDGVYVGGNNVKVTNNVIHDVAYNAGDSAGIRVTGNSAQISYNTIYNAGRNGIDQFGWQTSIQHNTIHDVLLQTSDGGGIYAVRSDGYGSVIAYNEIYNVRSGGFGGVGIYLDDDSNNYTVHHNIIWNVDHGMKLNYSSVDEHIYNNTLDAVQFSIAGTGGDWTGSVVENNIFTRAVNAGSGATIRNNITAGTNPRFASPSAGNYSLQAGSPAINAGLIIAPYTNGYIGSMPDDGAIEYGSSTFVSGASVTGLPPAPVMQLTAASNQPSPIPLPPRTTPATSTIDATNYAASHGIGSSYGGIGYLDNGDWAEYQNIDFGAGVSSVQFDLAVPSQYAGQKIQLRIDGLTGPIIGTLLTTSSGSWSTFTVQATAVTRVTGIHTLYLVFVGSYGIGNIEWFKFH